MGKLFEQRGLTFAPSLVHQVKEMMVKAVMHKLLDIRYRNRRKMFDLMLLAYLSKEMNWERALTCCRRIVL